MASGKGLWYDTGAMSAADLNLLIAPLYAFHYRQTGDVKYRDQGDQIFAGGVAGAYLSGGKQFSQNYRWSFKYVEWRQADPVQPPSSNVFDVNNDGSVNVSDVQSAVNQALGAASCGTGNVNGDGACNVADVQMVVNKALGL